MCAPVPPSIKTVERLLAAGGAIYQLTVRWPNLRDFAPLRGAVMTSAHHGRPRKRFQIGDRGVVDRMEVGGGRHARRAIGRVNPHLAEGRGVRRIDLRTVIVYCLGLAKA